MFCLEIIFVTKYLKPHGTWTCSNILNGFSHQSRLYSLSDSGCVSNNIGCLKTCAFTCCLKTKFKPELCHNHPVLTWAACVLPKYPKLIWTSFETLRYLPGSTLQLYQVVLRFEMSSTSCLFNSCSLFFLLGMMLTNGCFCQILVYHFLISYEFHLFVWNWHFWMVLFWILFDGFHGLMKILPKKFP